MLSNPTTLHQRQRQHRRQQSTPTAFEAPKVPILQNTKTNGSHRRGMSLDQRLRRQTPQQERTKVSTTNNGFQQTQQHILRETQQQRLARPGQQQQAPLHNVTNDENYLISPLASPLSQSFETACFNTYGRSQERPHSYAGSSGQMNLTARVHTDPCSVSNALISPDLFLFTDDGISSGFLDFSAGLENSMEQDRWATIRPSNRPPSSRRVSGGIADRVAIFEGMSDEQPSFRPVTPPTQYASSYFPPTPATTPFHRSEKQENVPQRFLDSYDTSMEDTIRPNRSQSNQRARSIFQEMRDHAEINSAAQPLESVPLSASIKCDSTRIPTSDFMDMSNINLEFVKNEHGFEPSQYSPTTSSISAQISQHSSPEMSRASLCGDPFEDKPELKASENSIYPGSPNSVHRNQARSPSADSPLDDSMDLDGVDLAETITDTGVTIDDIACYINGPDPVDQKWTCLFPECNKRFGRKENIKSHVQTHLGDRQYQCPHCKKCFVRQHDLKRHAKIHSGVKPYPCMCGNSFARHDALTRHRQRGMCIGAFEGVVKKVVKRGRPRKARPDTEERLDKASRTRSKNKAMSSASSTTGYSDSSSGRSPPGDLDILDDKPFRDFDTDFSQASMFVPGSGFEYSAGASPHPSDYVSPQALNNAPSPSAYSTYSAPSHHSYHSHRPSIDYSTEQPLSLLPALPASPAKSTASFYSTPPELCLSSSSPPPSQQQQSIYDPSSQSSEAHDDIDIDLSKLVALQDADFSTQAEDDMFMDAFGATSEGLGTSRLEQDPSLLLMEGKFEEVFGEWDSWT